MEYVSWLSSSKEIFPTIIHDNEVQCGLLSLLLLLLLGRSTQMAIRCSNSRSLHLLESKIQEARSKKDTLKARAQSAKTATKVSEMLGNVNTSDALSAFEKMEEKVMAMESQAEAVGQLTTDDLEGKFALLENSSVDDDLASLKRELSRSAPKGELPSGRTVSSSSTALPFQDVEIEKELNELRRQAKEY